MKKLIIANWKMNPVSRGDALALARATEQAAASSDRIHVVVAPPFPFLSDISALAKKAALASQDAFWEDQGAFTGEVSALQLQSMGVSHVILGHSERRMHLGETNEMVAKKTRAVLARGMTAILCVGEYERHGTDTPPAVATQTRAALADIKKSMLKRLVIAYEPVWAISTSKNAQGTATPDDMFRARLVIEKTLADLYDQESSRAVRIIYGGSVGADDIAHVLTAGQMDGALVGAASLSAEKFSAIVSRSAAV